MRNLFLSGSSPMDRKARACTVNPNVHVLLATDDPSASRSLAWTNSYGKAKVVTILLGHDNQVWTNPDFVKL